MAKLTPMRLFVILTVITVGLALGLPPNPHTVHQLHTTASAYRIAVAALLIPYVVIWYLSFYAYAKLKDYSNSLKGTDDGAALHKITIAMGAITLSLIVPTMASLILNNIATHDSGFKITSIIINNYINLFPGVISLLFLYNGTRALLRTAGGGIEKLDLRWHIPWLILFSIIFSHLTTQNQYRWHPYHLTYWLLVTTFIAPYLYGWVIGLLSAYDLNLYAMKVDGSLYRQAIRRFARGITLVIITSIAIQFLDVTIAQRISHSLASLVVADYMLLIALALGLGLIASGANRLKRIEEV